ncbi:hypothetical protein RJT34_15548 [Clitoria ternatea]|uniref:Receptor-like serine/threonine-protein kinase n=1 Tax=Clitoria ternatea TaxID=43366 RepID=A0AAN9J709_CLITE
MSLILLLLLLFLLLPPLISCNTIILRPNTTLLSLNQTFELGFFNLSLNNFYLAIRFTSLPPPNLIWLANRHHPFPSPPSLILTQTGQLLLTHSTNNTTFPLTNHTNAVRLTLLETGNLVLLTKNGAVSWQSFDHPTDTWLPGMNLTTLRSLVSWRTPTDPSPGLYSLRLKPPHYGEFELVFNDTVSYWSTGNWTNGSFVDVPEMTIPYLYRFDFEDPFSPMASFGFSERAFENGVLPPTMFRVEPYGQVRQYTWSKQAGSWNMFWSKPEGGVCQVPGLCGGFGVCTGEMSRLCQCLSGFRPLDGAGWGSGDYSRGCFREDACGEGDGFEDLGVLRFRFGNMSAFTVKNRDFCKKKCLGSCGCVGYVFDEENGLCKNFNGSLLDFQNLTNSGSSGGDGDNGGGVLYVRVPRGGSVKKGFNRRVLSGVIIGVVAILGVVVVTLLVLVKRKGNERKMKKGLAEDGFVPVLNLQVFSYKELQLATRGFSEKVGHGGFGTVFQGELSDSSLVAVKRLERPGGGEKEFRAEVSTIGNIQHVNLVRLRGFCSENSHRLLVYEYLENGSLSTYLRKDGPSLSWDVRFRVAIGTAKGIAYLHEECRCCIIHCDIKPENILLDSDFTAKVSDFGLAKLIGRDFSRVLATMRGTWGYVAPEWISGVAITTKADVYSYGMTLLELIGGRRNVEAPLSAGGGGENGCESGEKWFFPPWAAQQIIESNVTNVIDKRLGNVYNIEEAKRVALVAVWCIQDDEAMRPTMGMVVKMLEGLVEVTVPPPPKLLQALVTGESFHGVRVDSRNEASTGGSFSEGNLEVSTADSESYTGNVFSPLDVNNVSIQ